MLHRDQGRQAAAGRLQRTQGRPRQEEERQRGGRAVGRVRQLPALDPPDLRPLQQGPQQPRRALPVPRLPAARAAEGRAEADGGAAAGDAGRHGAAGDPAVALPGEPHGGVHRARTAHARGAAGQAAKRGHWRRGAVGARGQQRDEKVRDQAQVRGHVWPERQLPDRLPVPAARHHPVPEPGRRRRVPFCHVRAGVRARVPRAQRQRRLPKLPRQRPVLPPRRRGRRGLPQPAHIASYVCLPPASGWLPGVRQAARVQADVHLGVPAHGGRRLHPLLPPKQTEDASLGPPALMVPRHAQGRTRTRLRGAHVDAVGHVL
mmetsp:Transcript_3745/g.10569  ORF Transcript_3745/g.10569 Transcript_3745/m.10569 type:complete len:318 (-) Transcript_3745:2647-3600(-)